jgi:hypothetical protein
MRLQRGLFVISIDCPSSAVKGQMPIANAIEFLHSSMNPDDHLSMLSDSSVRHHDSATSVQ